MGKKKIGIAFIATILFGIFALAGCTESLENHKVSAIKTIETHASTKISENDYTNAGLQAIAKAVTDGKDAVGAAVTPSKQWMKLSKPQRTL